MPYPQDQETFRRVINRNLTEKIPGTTLDENDQNLPASFLEKLQNLIGYKTPTPGNTIYERLDAMPNLVNIKKIQIMQGVNFTCSGGISEVSPVGEIANTVTGQRISFLISFKAGISASATWCKIEAWYNENGGTYYQLKGGIIVERGTASGDRGITWFTQYVATTDKNSFGIALKGVAGSGTTDIRKPIIVAILWTA